MNRHNLFRGKRSDNGEWVEEYLVIHSGVYWIYTGEIDQLNHFDNHYGTNIYSAIRYLINKTTICRCTGKEYMDGEMAYEGDVFESQTCGVKMVLKYGTYQAYCPADDCFMDNVGFYAEADGYPQMPIGDISDYALKIGTIFEDCTSISIQGETENEYKYR